MAELSDKELKINIWWITHRHQLKKWWVLLLTIGVILLWLYLLFNILLILITWTKFTSIPFQISKSLVDFKSYQQVNTPQAIQVVTTKTIRDIGKRNNYHLISQLKNPNNKWFSNHLVFHFVLDGKSLAKNNSFLLPQEERFIIQYNVESDKVSPNLQLVIDEIIWQRVERPEKLPPLDFEIKNIKSALIPLKEKDKDVSSSYSTRVTAEIKNKSLYNYRQVKFIVLLYQGTEEVAVNETTIEKFLTQETKNLEVFWKETYPAVSKVVIEPEVNVLDPNAVFETEEPAPSPLF